MSFLYPAAFAGLASIVVLILLSLWRQRARRVVVPSLRLWEKISDRLPPVRALERPRASLSLLLQILIATVLVLAMAGPGIVRMGPAPRKIAVVVDLSAAMAPRLESAKEEIRKLDPEDEIVWIESPSLKRHRGLRDLGSIQAEGPVADPAPALDLAASESTTLLFVSDRPPAWSPPQGARLHLVLVGGPLDTNGIIDAGFDGKRMFVRLIRAAEMELTSPIETRRLPSANFHLIDAPDGVNSLEVKLEPDEFPADDRVAFQRALGLIDVGFEGRPDASILAAIESNPRARVVRGGMPGLLIRIGTAAGESKAPVVVDVDPKEGISSWGPPGEISLGRGLLVDGVDPDDLKFTEVGTIEGSIETPLMFGGGAPIAAVRAQGRIVVAVKYSSTGWPARPSFPIFWSNVIRYAASGLGTWRATGLLDEAASRPGTVRQSFDPAALDARPLAPRRSDLAGAALALAAALLAGLWFVESRHRE